MRKFAFLIVVFSAHSLAEAQMDKGQLLYELAQETEHAFSRNEHDVWELSDAVFHDGKAKCADYLEQLRAQGVPGTTKVTLTSEQPDLTPGEHSIDALRPACERVVKYGKIKLWEKWAVEAMRDNARLTNGQQLVSAYMQNCLTTYETMIKSGISPNEQVIPRTVNDNAGKPVNWSGSVSELRGKWCEAGLAKVSAKLDEQDAPFKKVLKADKLADALLYRSFWLVGGRSTDDPKVMAKANVLFTDSSPSEFCVSNGAQVHVLTRLQYNAAHKLVKTSTSRHCGNPPAGAYK